MNEDRIMLRQLFEMIANLAVQVHAGSAHSSAQLNRIKEQALNNYEKLVR